MKAVAGRGGLSDGGLERVHHVVSTTAPPAVPRLASSKPVKPVRAGNESLAACRAAPREL